MKLVVSVVLAFMILAIPVQAETEKPSCSVTANSIKIDQDLKKGNVVKVYNTLARLVKVHEISKDSEELKVCDVGLTAGEYYLTLKSNGLPWWAGKVTVK